MNGAQDLALSEILDLWTRRADHLFAAKEVTVKFRSAAAAAAAAVDEHRVPIRRLAHLMGVSPRAAMRHVQLGREQPAAQPAEV